MWRKNFCDIWMKNYRDIGRKNYYNVWIENDTFFVHQQYLYLNQQI